VSWILAAAAAWWMGAAGARARRDLLRLDSSEGEVADYATASLLRRLRDDPAGLALRLRLSRFLAVLVVPMGFALGCRSLGPGPATLAFFLGWLLMEATTGDGEGVQAGRLALPAGRRAIAFWARLTGVWLRVARPLTTWRPGEPGGSTRSRRGLVLAESQAALAPRGAGLGREERKLLRRILASKARLVGDIMTPWARVVALEADTPREEAIRRILDSGRSRLPLLAGGRIVGLATIKDLLVGKPPRPVYFVRWTTTVQELLEELQKAYAHLAVVVDALGRPVGLATVEDILEEIVGELYDEREAPEGTR